MQAGIPKKYSESILDVLIAGTSMALLLWVILYALLLWESPERLILVFVPGCVILWALHGMRSRSIIPGGYGWNIGIGALVITLMAITSVYFYREY